MKKHYIHGILASIFLALIYFSIVTVFQGLSHAIDQFFSLWYLMIPLIIGFGIQISLFSYIKSTLKAKASGVAASGGVSTASMIACCAHHLTDILPIIGLSGAALFLSQYQTFFILIGIFSNIVGIAYLLNIMQKNSLYQKSNFLEKLFVYDMKKIRNVTLIISILILSISFFTIKPVTSSNVDLQSLTDTKNGITVEVQPINIGNSKDTDFFITLTTHQSSLDFDMAKVSVLEDNTGKVYYPIKWEGSSPGGHHRNGNLIFPSLDKEANYIKLKINNEAGISERIFEWKL